MPVILNFLQKIFHGKMPPMKKPRSFTKRGAAADVNPANTIRVAAPETCSKEKAARVSPDKPLTEQQLAFAKGWAAGESITTAAHRAGYADDRVGYRMAVMPNILRVYHAEKVRYEEASQMTRKRVMDGLLEAVDMAKLLAEPASMVSGWREIGKMCGYYEPVKRTLDINIKGDVTVRQLNGMSDAELLKLIHASPDAAPLLEAVTEDEEQE